MFSLHNNTALATPNRSHQHAQFQRTARFLVLFAFLFVLYGCSGEPCPNCDEGLGVFATTVPNQRLIFSIKNSRSPREKSFTLYNKGNKKLTVISMVIVDDARKMFRLVNPPSLPFDLKPGQDHGVSITIRYRAQNPLTEQARLLLSSPDADNVTSQGYFAIDLFHQKPSPEPIYSCDKRLDFGLVPFGQTMRRVCAVTNRGDQDLQITKVTYKPSDGENKAFRWQSPASFPIVVPAQATQVVELSIAFVPPNEHKTEYKGTFTLTTNAPSPQEILVMGSVKRQLVPQGPCQLEVSTANLVVCPPKVSPPITLKNLGKGTCLIKRVGFQRSGNKGPFALLKQPEPLTKILPSKSLALHVVLKGDVLQIKSDTLIIESDDPNNLTRSVSVTFDPLCLKRRCEIHPITKRLNFGYVKVGQAKAYKAVFQNNGSDTCRLLGMSVAGTKPAGNNAFSKEPTKFPIDLKSGERATFIVKYAPPQEQPGYEGRFILVSNDQDTPSTSIDLYGMAREPCLTVEPKPINVGVAQVGCSNLPLKVSVYHLGLAKCQKEITLNQVELGPSSPFSIKGFKKTTLRAGESADFSIQFKPTRLGTHSDTLILHSTIYGQSQLTHSVLGEGVKSNEQKDVFQQPGLPKVDVLWVIDDSSTVGDDQQHIADNLKTFMQWATRTATDYRIMVTTTDVTGRRGGGGCVRGTPSYITPQTPNPVDAFLKNAKVGTSGSATEKGLKAAQMALSSPAINGCNFNVFRKDATLAVFIMSDENEQSSEPASFYTTFFKTVKGVLYPGRARVSVVVGPPPNGCRTEVRHAVSGPKYWEVAKDTNGLQLSFCEKNWGGQLSQIGPYTLRFNRVFALSRRADPKSITVKVNGAIIPESTMDGWWFDSTSNTITFTHSRVPPAKAIVQVDYKALCQ